MQVNKPTFLSNSEPQLISHQRRIPPFKALRAFESAARHRSFSRAANELNVTRAAISQQIRLLEEYLDARLFERSGAQIILTEQALHYLPLLTDTLNKLCLGTGHLFGKKARQTLSIRVAQSFCHTWLLPRLADFHRRHPDITLQFYSTTNLYPSNNNVVDLEIINGYGHWDDVIYEPLTSEEKWQVVASPSFTKQFDFTRPIEEIATFPKLATLGYSEGWKEWFSLHQEALIFSEPVMSFDSTQLSMEAAIQGLGMLLAKSILVEDAIKQNDLVVVQSLSMPSNSQHYLVKNQTPSNGTKINHFCHWLKQCGLLCA
ncbi:LysR substrate-binding domain-containing protein [Vibrio methylphosphonaticus]|uniref:LysR substrate-binding domain-containing protein n=1 Tax=Vibrio methylphosphonaticus TaxID=2946866 RepID=UPI00202A78EB|nr:LysR substrate-binding domain-containing protein [Vibrio methylphosphonaticus]MCL9776886.1 LysR substrate-binding domain-containing protein [Vibrio methylphosphonaticus]